MLDDTILNNVTFNLIESEIDFNFEKCLEEAQLLSFVNSLDEKSSTNIGEKGTRLWRTDTKTFNCKSSI